ncbi:unnamed protein product [Cyprideis torosa]|uniref:Uncharacterized protein n=1 Tax=Cyprideis torosa TaxID=163714 RepID=A0A7R8ZMN2_9CRUS|nr:unnamed protein product [Cyprideis torosa]CAG0889343.1 unnamed protein product [Cyprideis torosa]
MKLKSWIKGIRTSGTKDDLITWKTPPRPPAEGCSPTQEDAADGAPLPLSARGTGTRLDVERNGDSSPLVPMDNADSEEGGQEMMASQSEDPFSPNFVAPVVKKEFVSSMPVPQASQDASMVGSTAGDPMVGGGSHQKFSNPDLPGYLGFANLPNQVHRKFVKKGFEFTLMVVGESGLGKSTLINSMFLTDLYPDRIIPSAEDKIKSTVKIEASTVEIEERGVKLRLTVVDTPGFGDGINNSECFKPIIQYVDEQYERYLRDESGLNRRNIIDNRVHCCFYFISPLGHGLKPIDVEFMRQLHTKVNVVPVIAKADTLTRKELLTLKKKIMAQIEEKGIRIYTIPDCDVDEDDDYKEQLSLLRASVPFAVSGSNQLIEVRGKKIRGRLYPWGVVEVENPEHCDFIKLRAMLVMHMQDLQEVTQEVHYENYRSERLAKGAPAPATLAGKRSGAGGTAAASAASQESEADRLLKAKEEEIRKMKEMLSQMQQQIQQQQGTHGPPPGGSQFSQNGHVDHPRPSRLVDGDDTSAPPHRPSTGGSLRNEDSSYTVPVVPPRRGSSGYTPVSSSPAPPVVQTPPVQPPPHRHSVRSTPPPPSRHPEPLTGILVSDAERDELVQENQQLKDRVKKFAVQTPPVQPPPHRHSVRSTPPPPSRHPEPLTGILVSDAERDELVQENQQLKDRVKELERLLEEEKSTSSSLREDIESNSVLVNLQFEALDQFQTIFQQQQNKIKELEDKYSRLKDEKKHWEEAALKLQDKYQRLKSEIEEFRREAEGKISITNRELEDLGQQKEMDDARLQAMVRKAESRVSSLEQQLKLKSDEAAELSSICEDLLKRRKQHGK